MNLRPLLGLLLLLAPVAADAQSVVPHDSKFEASWTLPNQTGNPFDPADNDVDVVFNGPLKTKTIQPAFWDGDRWRVRFAPARVGAYTLQIMRNGSKASPMGLSASRFRCIASQNPGFVRLDPHNAQRFVFDNGQTYYPHGMDAAWLGAGQSYDDTFTPMQAAGMNWVRIWMNQWDGKNLDWAQNKADQPKLGTLLIPVARRWDTILEDADKHGIYVQMTLQHHGQYTAHTDPNWPDNPWNAANGGFLANPDDFFTNAEARRLTRIKYRYIAARYGYSTHLLSYELFNEVQNSTETQSHFGDVVNWHKEMAAALRADDVNHHLLTTSNSNPGTPLAEIGLDYDQIHTYVPDIISFFAGIKRIETPVFVGEWGPADTKTDMTESFLHDGLWSSVMAPTAGAGQFWYGDEVVKHHWWPQYTSVAGFLKTSAQADDPTSRLKASITASGPLGDLSFTPTGGWEPFTRDSIAVPFGGAAPDLSGLSSYFQGANHKDLRPHPITFLVNCPGPCRFIVSIGTVAKAGAHPVLSAGGKTVAADFPAADADHDGGQTLTADLPAGPSRVTLDNTGPDWFIPRFTVTHYAPPVAVLAKGSPHAAEFWAYNRNRTGASPADATLTLSGPAPGAYTVLLWDTWAGHALPPVSATVQNGTLTVPLPQVTRDIAGVVTPR